MSADNRTRLGRLITALRAGRGITQKQLSAKTGISEGNISKIERGRYNPTVDLLDRLLGAMEARLTIEEQTKN